MENSNLKKLIIVGGGSAGWMTAVYLNRVLNHSKKNFDITVIESPDIGVIGVGESTVHSVRHFFAGMGLDEFELVRETNASFKLGIMFDNWRKPENGKMHRYFHPFEQMQLGVEQDLATQWNLQKSSDGKRYDEWVSASQALLEKGHGPKNDQSHQYQGAVPYGYHIDAVLLGRYLRRKGVEAGITYVEATVSDVNVVDGNIESVETNEERYSADFFIDCTGFRGVLIGALKKDNWVSFKDALPCDRAVAMQSPLEPDEIPVPFTTATAMDHGWAWKIDLNNRRGFGYVYDSAYLSQEEAEQALRAHVGPDRNFTKCVHMRFRTGCREETWVGNCIATGLAGGFIEPLESTGLHLINLAAGLMGTHLLSLDRPDAARRSFNRLMSAFYQDLKQFIVLHYCLTDRDDTPFWQNAPATVDHCEWLKDQLEVWKHKTCEFYDLAGSSSSIFSDENYRYVLYGMQHYPDLDLNLDTEDLSVFETAQKIRATALARTEPMEDYLRSLAI